MSDDCDHEAILTGFRSRSSARRDKAIREAYFDGHADQLMAQMLDESGDRAFARVVIAAHLGDLSGAGGDTALRRAVRESGPGSRDLRSASLLALAKRVGALATPDLLVGLAVSDAVVRDYAVIGLAGTGDDQAWEQVLAYLRMVLRRKHRTQGQSEVAVALAYLAQHVSDPFRRSELVAFVRQHWNAIDEAGWFARLWPDAAPSGPALDALPTLSGPAIQDWVRDPLFRPLGPPEG